MNVEAKKYYGTMPVEAWPEEKRGHGGYLHGDEIEQGYAVKYSDGYTSWSPKEVFEKHYQPLDALSFGYAMEAVKAGHRVTRAVSGGAFFVLKTECGRISMCVSGNYSEYRPTQDAMHANDWQVIE